MEAAWLKIVNMKDLSGEELYHRFLMGDAGAFEKLVVLYEGELSQFLYGIVHDYHETKHLMIEAFAQLAVSGENFAEQSSLKTYLFTIGEKLAARYVKMCGNEQHMSFEDIIETLADSEKTPPNLMAREECKRQLHETMLELKEELRVVLILLYFEDMSYIQAGQAMSKTEKQIKHLAYRAKAALKKQLDSNGLTHA